MFSRTVYPLERFFVEKDFEIVYGRNSLHRFHQKHVVIDGYVGLFVYRCDLELIEGYFVMACFDRYSKFHALLFQFAQEFEHTFRYCAEIVVVHLLAFGRRLSEKRTSCKHQVWARIVQGGIHQKIFLLGSECGVHFGYVLVEILAHGSSGSIDGCY